MHLQMSTSTNVSHQRYQSTSLETLLGLLIETVKDFCDAEAASLLLHDPVTDELYFDVAVGEAGQLVKRVRLPRGTGIAGCVFDSLQPMLVAQADSEPRFSPVSDQLSGFKTQSIVAIPLVDLQGTPLGVVEAINRRGQRSFREAELARLLLIQEPLSAAVTAAQLMRSGSFGAIADFYSEFIRIVTMRVHLLQQNQEALEKERQVFAHERNRVLREARIAGLCLFVAGLSHEMNNPLGFVCSNLRSLKDQLGDMQACLREIHQHAQDRNDTALAHILARFDAQEEIDDGCANVAETLVGLQRLERIAQRLSSFSNMSVQRTDEVDLNQIIREAVDAIDPPRLGKKRLLYTPVVVPLLKGSRQHLRQVVGDLLDNALKHTDEAGCIRVSLSTSDDELQLAVSDNGQGIEHDKLERIFDPFFTDKKRDFKSTGLGLASVHGVIMAHGGRVDVASEPGVGSTFVITLPRTDEDTRLSLGASGARGLRYYESSC